MGTHHISALEEYLHDQAGITPDESPRWLFIHLLDELVSGRVAYRTTNGRLDSLDDILMQDFWVFGLMQDVRADEVQSYYRPFRIEDGPVPLDIRRSLKRAIMAHQGHPSAFERSGDIVHLMGQNTIAAMSAGRDPEGAPLTVLYWNPYFTADIAVGLLQETVRIDDAQ